MNISVPSVHFKLFFQHYFAMRLTMSQLEASLPAALVGRVLLGSVSTSGVREVEAEVIAVSLVATDTQ